jgi:rhomboid protease GluP
MGSFRPPPQEPVYRGPDNEPQILPPGTAYVPPQPVRRQRQSWMVAPATYVLIGINCLVFLVMLASHVSFLSPSSTEMMRFGADNAGSVLINGEWSRIVTAMFVHVGIIHLATNMWCLWNLGLLAEPLMGSAGVLALYILTGAAGNLLSTFVNLWMAYPAMSDLTDLARRYGGPVPVEQLLGVFPAGAGASGAVFGIAGALIVLLGSPRLPVPPEELSKLRRSVMYFAGINLLIGLGTMAPGSPVHIDNMAHLGGCACGFLFAAPLVPRIGSPKDLFIFRRRIAVLMVTTALVLFGTFIARFAGY